MADNGGRVLGFGGLFFRARDPDALTAWYREVLGVGAGCASGDEDPSEWYWQAQGGETVFAPFRHDTDYFAADKQFMINLRVSGLDELVARLEAQGVAAERRRMGRPRDRPVRANPRSRGQCNRAVGAVGTRLSNYFGESTISIWRPTMRG
jgi:hypothetical protein